MNYEVEEFHGMKKTNRKKTGDGAFLDPTSVGSSIRWSYDVYKYGKKKVFSAEIVLTDCDRPIYWSAYGSEGFEDMRVKLQNASDILADAIAGLEVAEDNYNKIKVKKKNDKSKK